MVKLTHLGKLATKQKYNVGPMSLGQRWATVSNSHRANVYTATVSQPNYNIGATLAQRLYVSWVLTPLYPISRYVLQLGNSCQSVSSPQRRGGGSRILRTKTTLHDILVSDRSSPKTDCL